MEFGHYHLRMQRGNVLVASVCVYVCLSVCLSVCNALTIEDLELERSFLVRRQVLRIVLLSTTCYLCIDALINK